MTQSKLAKGIKRHLMPYLFLIPIYLLIVTFKYIPFGTAIQKSFYNWDGGNTDIFVGLQNYIDIFKDPIFFTSLRNVAVVCVAYILIAITIPLLAAELVFSLKSQRLQYHLRTTFTFPMVVPGVVTILLWKWILAGDYGILNQLLKGVGLGNLASPWLGQSQTALGAIIAIGFPWLGIAMLGGMQFLIYFGALQGIPSDLFEVAKIDGINVWQRFRYIDLPMLSSQLKLMVTLAVINGLQIFDSVYIINKGGPGTSTMTPAVYIYEQGFNYGRMGYSSAIGVVLFLLIMILTVINQTLIKNTDTID
ncbi:MAG: carbohydrate ABC transporter permease [Oscillospiraceae bacterium]